MLSLKRIVVSLNLYILFSKHRYRDVSVYAKGFTKDWNSQTVFELKWDANRDPDQKFLVNFKTNTSDINDGEQFLGLLMIEYPGRIVNTNLELKYIGMVIELTCLPKVLFLHIYQFHPFHYIYNYMICYINNK